MCLLLFTILIVVINRSLTDEQVKDMKIKMLPGYSDPHGKRYKIISCHKRMKQKAITEQIETCAVI